MNKIIILISMFLIGCATETDHFALKRMVEKQQEEIEYLRRDFNSYQEDTKQPKEEKEEITGIYTIFSGGVIGGWDVNKYFIEGNCISFKDINNKKKYKACGQFVIKNNFEE
jgi:hypothetical protein